MNYRHIYHAGNICDVVKHAILTLVLAHLRTKDKGFAVLDTHAGVGLYDLQDERSQKTGEAATGILALLQAKPLPQLQAFYGILRRLNPLWNGPGTDNFRTYPGSPLIAFHMLREQDRLVVCELHPDDAEALRRTSPDDKRMQIHCRDGYEALTAFLPPPEKRGLVLIDPPYEEPNEFDNVVKRVKDAHRRWPTGIYMLWYPIKDRPGIWRFHEALASSGIGKILCAEFIYNDETNTDRLNGSGMIIINPPWKLDEELNALLPALHKALGAKNHGNAVKWLVA